MTEMSARAPNRSIRLAVLLAAALLLLAGLAGCGEDPEDSASLDYEAALAGAPAPLAAIHDQGNEILGGGLEAYRERLKELQGYPVIVNKWASWCGPCRFEFPAFQRLSARFGKRVAFLGVDSDDSEDAAATFLEEYPVPYPSYSDPDEEIAKELTDFQGFPVTAYYDRGGELLYTKLGPYTSDEEFVADIERYALGDES
jgi:thiol-disulfide isomerase/thioredoxin